MFSVVNGYLDLKLDFGDGLVRVSSSEIGTVAGRLADAEPHKIAVELDLTSAVLVLDGQGVSSKEYGDVIFPVDNLYVGESFQF